MSNVVLALACLSRACTTFTSKPFGMRHDLFDGHRPLGVRHRVQALRRGERSIGRGSGGVDELLAVLNSGYTEARKRERRVREWLVTLALEPPPGFSSADGEWVLVDD